VLLLHDVFANRRSFDLDERHSLARFLARSGMDVWLGEFRGCGFSQGPAWYKDETYDWDFDDLALRDVPALLNGVAAKTGRSVAVLAHGVGGMALLACLGTHPDPRAAALVCLGVPGRFDDPSDVLLSMASRAPLADERSGVPTELGAVLPAPFEGAHETLFSVVIFNDRATAPAAADLFQKEGLSRLSPGAARQIAVWMRDRTFRSSDGSVDYLASLARIEIPILLVAGKVDNLAPPGDVLHIQNRIGSRDKTYVLLSTAGGYSHNYGHMGMLIGEKAGEEVFPLIHGWLLKRSGKQAAPEGSS
jgi:pimeloyl-ACP methyl ester carboxylesterase